MKINFIRRVVTLSILTLFLLGNFKIYEILVGDLSSSVLFGKISLSDPFAVLQIIFTGVGVGASAISGALIVLIFYALIAPRAFCGWVCPVNLITDFANFIRKKFGFYENFIKISPKFRYLTLILSLMMSSALGIQAFENISQIGALTRSIVFLSADFFGIFIVIFAIDCFLGERLICSNICPLGAFYAFVGKFSLIRIFHTSENCTKCMKCKAVCPEKQVLEQIAKKDFKISSECISCGRCVDVCEDNALNFNIQNLKEKK